MEKLFYPEGERIVRQSIDKWESDLRDQFSLLLSREREDDWNYQLLILTNQASLVSAYLGKNELAYRICYGAISFFMNNQTSEKYVDGIFQPWINIGRLNIIERNFAQAHRIFDNINPYSDTCVINNNIIKKNILKKEILILLKNCFFYEKFKIYINDTKNIKKMFIFCDEHQENFKEYYELFLESKVLSLVSMNEYSRALEAIVNSVQEVDEKYMPIFILRLFDLSIYLKESLDKAKILIVNLFIQHIDYIQSLNLQGLYFCLEICKRLKSIGETEHLLHMLGELIQRFKEINEEVGLIESLDLGRSLSPQYRESFYLILNKTKYAFLKKKFLRKDVSYSFPLGEKISSFLNTET